MRNNIAVAMAFILSFFIILPAAGFSRDLTYKDITIDNVSRYNEDRISYQQVRSEERRVGKECRSRW